MAEGPWACELAAAAAIAREAGALLRGMHGRVRDVRHKGMVDLVTEADQASEALIAARLREAFPGDALLAEEETDTGLNAGARRRWIVDPLDGTTNFAHGHPVFAVSIALEADGQIVAGVVFDPLRDELFGATCGGGATLNGAPIRVSAIDALIEALLVTGFAYDVRRRLENIAYLERFVAVSQAVRREGSAALDLCYVACGRFDGYWERGVNAWDIAAASLILEEAGGVLGGYARRPFDVYGRELVASNVTLHDAMQAIIASVIEDSGLGPEIVS